MSNLHRKATAKGQMSSSGLGPAIANLPLPLKAMFEPRPPMEFQPPLVKRKMPPYTGIGAWVSEMETEPPPLRSTQETPKERQARLRVVKAETAQRALDKAIEAWKPNELKDGTQDAYKTLFIGRLSYEVTEGQLRREMEQYGKIAKICMVKDHEGQPRGYAFVEFESEEDMKVAYRRADGRKLEGKRIVVDVERGRTVREWKPRRLGGGIGETRKGGSDVNVKYSGREALSASSAAFARRDSSRSVGGPGTSVYGGSRGADDPYSSRYGGGGGSSSRRLDSRGSYRRDSDRDRGRDDRDRGRDDRESRGSSSYGRSRSRDRDGERRRESRDYGYRRY